MATKLTMQHALDCQKKVLTASWRKASNSRQRLARGPLGSSVCLVLQCALCLTLPQDLLSAAAALHLRLQVL